MSVSETRRRPEGKCPVLWRFGASRMTTVLCLVAVWVVVLSAIGLGMMGYDKSRARRGRGRLPERRLLLFASFGAAPGTWLGMVWLRHKTRHLRFRLLVPTFALVWLAVALWSLASCVDLLRT